MNRDDIIRMAREAEVPVRGHYDEQGLTPQELERFANIAAAAEREACEDIDTEYDGEDVLATWCASAIRARSSK